MGNPAKVHTLKEAEQGGTVTRKRRGLTPWEEMDRVFDSLLQRPWFRPLSMESPGFRPLDWQLENRVPAVDIIDHEEELLVKVEVPGVKKEELEITLTEDAVTIKGETRHESKDEKENFYHSEIMTGSFSRMIGLPCSVDTENAKAEFEDGLLSLHLPKVERTKRRTLKVD